MHRRRYEGLRANLLDDLQAAGWPAIARRLVESWGGVITLESEPGKDTVTLTLQTAS